MVSSTFSDRRLKDYIKLIKAPLEIIAQISGNTFDWNEQRQNTYIGRDYGVIAQEIQSVMPELVETKDNGYLAVRYDKLIALLIEAIKQQQIIIDNQKESINDIKVELNARLENIEEKLNITTLNK